MSASASTIIHRQVLEIILSAPLPPDQEEKARELAARMAEIMDQVLQPLAASSRWWILDRLDWEWQLDHGPEWEQRILDQWESRLQQWVAERQLDSGGGEEGMLVFADGGQRRAALRDFLLERGYMPWWSRPEQKVFWEEWILEGGMDPRYLGVPGTPAVLDRWMEIMGSRISAFLRSWEPLVQSPAGPSFLRFYRALTETGRASLRRLAAAMVRPLVEAHWGRTSTPDSFFRAVDRPLEGKAGREAISLHSSLIKDLWEQAYGPTNQDQGMEAGFWSLQQRAGTEEEEIPPPLERASPDRDGGEGEDEMSSGRSFTSYWGGMVLLAPFFPRFFERIGLDLEHRKEDKEKAYLLCHYLASGQEEVEPGEGGLFKILLGVDPGQGIPWTGESLDQGEKQEADSLLEAVAEHWKKLGRSSGKALREHFFHREARIKEIQGGWEMVVRPEALDVLIPFIPWTIGLIQLPWMNSPLYTDWKA